MSLVGTICTNGTIYSLVNVNQTDHNYELLQWPVKNDQLSRVSSYKISGYINDITKLEGSSDAYFLGHDTQGSKIHIFNQQTSEIKSISTLTLPENENINIVKFIEFNSKYYIFFYYRPSEDFYQYYFECNMNECRQEIGDIKLSNNILSDPSTNLIFDQIQKKFWVINSVAIGQLISMEKEMKIEYYDIDLTAFPRTFMGYCSIIYDNYLLCLSSAILPQYEQNYLNSIFVADLHKLQNDDVANKFEIVAVESLFPNLGENHILVANTSSKHHYLISGYIKAYAFQIPKPNSLNDVQLLIEKFYAYKKKICLINNIQKCFYSSSFDCIINKFVKGEELPNDQTHSNKTSSFPVYKSIEIVNNSEQFTTLPN